MQLIQILLPLYDNRGQPIPGTLFVQVRDELTARFGGVTAYNRAPASGTWREGDGHQTRDDIVIYEVMTENPDRVWWRDYRITLEQRFEQDTIVMRALPIDML